MNRPEITNKKDFRKDLEKLINCHSKEYGSNTPDFLLADFLMGCLHVFDNTVKERSRWYKQK